MAEAFLNRLCPEFFEAHSAGLEPGTLNPLVVEAMEEVGIDISQNQTKSVFDMFRGGSLFAYVVAVCDGANAERCPVFPGAARRLEWSFADPSAIPGTHDERMERVREIRDAIERRVQAWCDEMCVAEQTA